MTMLNSFAQRLVINNIKKMIYEFGFNDENIVLLFQLLTMLIMMKVKLIYKSNGKFEI